MMTWKMDFLWDPVIRTVYYQLRITWLVHECSSTNPKFDFSILSSRSQN